MPANGAAIMALSRFGAVRTRFNHNARGATATCDSGLFATLEMAAKSAEMGSRTRRIRRAGTRTDTSRRMYPGGRAQTHPSIPDRSSTDRCGYLAAVVLQRACVQFEADERELLSVEKFLDLRDREPMFLHVEQEIAAAAGVEEIGISSLACAAALPIAPGGNCGYRLRSCQSHARR